MSAEHRLDGHVPGLVDIIVPTNRVSPFLSTALDSVRKQRYGSWRLVIVDDGSGVPQELDRLAAAVPSARVIHQAHAGVSAARNVAIRNGDGEFIAFLDDDDVWPAERLGELVSTLQAHAEAAGVFGNGRYIDAEGRVIGKWETMPASREAFLSGVAQSPRITTLLIRRSVLENIGLFDERLAYAEDSELMLRILRSATLVSSPTVVVDYRRHDHNVTLHDWRVRHRAGQVAVETNIAAAEQLGDKEQVALLRQNLRRWDAANAADSAGRVIGNLKARRFRRAALDVRYSLRIAPMGFLRGAIRTVGSRIRSRLARQHG